MNMKNKHHKFYKLIGLIAVIVLTLSITIVALALSIGTYDQCANDQGDGYPGSVCNWINGNLQHSNSTYHEGDATVQRLWLTDLITGTHTVTFDYGTTKGGKHAYDFLTSWNWSESWITEASRCEDIDWCAGVSESYAQIPLDPNAQGLDAAADLVQPRRFTMRGGNLNSISTPAIVSGSYAGDSDTRITVTFNIPEDSPSCTTDKKGVTTCEVVIWFGAHVARSDEWDTGGAGDIPGSPYHVSLALVDGDSAGSRDNQMASTTIIQNGTITIVKDAVPNDPQDFSFNLTDSLLYNQNFSLDDDSDATLPNSRDFDVPPGTYTAQELSIPLGWHLTNLVCIDPTSNTTVNLATATASINVASGETVICTFTDTFQRENPSVVTEIHNVSEAVVTSVPLGSTVHDKATVSGVGGFPTPTGTVDFTWYPNGTCEGTGTAAGTVTLASGVAHPSSSQGPLAAGSYSFEAHYNGDTYYNSADSACEPLTVGKAQLGISTEVHNDDGDVPLVGDLPLGGGAHDSATVTGKVDAYALPNVTFYFFEDGVTCTNGDTTGGTTLNTLAPDGTTGIAHPSTSETNLAAGDYNFMAEVAGNDNYEGAISDCEPFTVEKKQLGISTKVHNSAHEDQTNQTVPLGSIMHDSASVTGKVNSFDLPAVSFTFFENGTCADEGTPYANYIPAAPDQYASVNTAALAYGSYSFQASVAGNDNYIGATAVCEPFSVGKAQLGISTEVHNDDGDVPLVGDLPLGGGAHDSATVTGKVNSFTLPDVTFYFFEDGVTCSNGDTTGGTTLNTLTPDGTTGIAHPSTSETNLAAGDYNFMAEVAGNDNYEGAISDCEPFTVDKAQLTVTTAVHDAAHNDKTYAHVPLGSIMHDTAAVTGGVNGFALPLVSFSFFTNDTCTGVGTPYANNGTPAPDTIASVSTASLGAGPYAFQAVVAGDDNYFGDTSECEWFTVDKASLSISTNIHNANHQVVTSVFENSIVHDTAAVVGGVGSFTLPPVNFTFFDNGTCTGEGSAVANDGKEGILYKSADSDPLEVGNYSYHAIVDSNSNYTGATSSCEPLVVNPPTAALLPTQTTCQMYRDGLWPPMYDSFTYGVKGGAINSISPGVIFYYNRITAIGTSITVEETNDLGWPPMLVHSSLDQAILYNLDCEKVAYAANATGSSSDPYIVTFTGLTPETEYIIGIKYSPANLVGTGASSYPTNTYYWEMDGYPGSAVDIDVEPR
jgi:hypothetical protein